MSSLPSSLLRYFVAITATVVALAARFMLEFVNAEDLP